MKNKGFTLVELLAVIMILGIIALIMTPIFTDVIKRNRTKAYEISAKEYIKEIETKLEKLELINPVNYTDCIVVSKTNKLTCGEDTIELNYEGNSPTSGTIKLEGLSVVSATLAFENDNVILFDGKNFQVGKNDEIYTITFDPMGGTISQPTKQISKGSTYGDLPIPKKDGYIFKGWYMNLVKVLKFDNYEINSSTGIPKTTTSTSYGSTLDLVPVKGGTKFYSNVSICGIYTFNENQQFIKRENNYTKTITISNNAKYMRIELATINLSVYLSTLIITDNEDNLTYNNVQNKITSSMKTANNSHTLYAAWEAK